MKIHYFQRYHQKENVATANTMLLLSRLYSYSPDKFYRLLRSFFFEESFEPEMNIDLQVKGDNSVPDAVIVQPGFKIIVETKLDDWFHSDQLKNHLSSFKDENRKVLLTIASEKMEQKKLEEFQKELDEFNKTQKIPVFHVNTTFEELTQAVQDVIDENDAQMQDILEDYLDFCYDPANPLIKSYDAWKYLRVQLAGRTLEFCKENGVYYDLARHGFREHEYLGLYKQKSVRAIGKIEIIIPAVMKDGDLDVQFPDKIPESKREEYKQRIRKAMEEAKKNGDTNLETARHNYFFVEQFYETDFKKTSSRAPFGSRIFDLSKILGIKDKLPGTKEIAEILKTKTWE